MAASVRIFGVLLGLLVPSLSTTSMAQGVPYVPPELHQELRRLQGDTITFCIWSDVSPTADLDRRVAEAVGETLLLEVRIVEHESYGPLSTDEFDEEVFIQLGEECDAIAGFVLARQGYPEWLAPTRAYLSAPFVGVVRNDAPYERLGDVPPAGIVGAQAYTEGDLQLINYLNGQPANQRWRRFPYSSMTMLAEHVGDGVIDAGVVWQPSWRTVRLDPMASDLRTISIDPVPNARSSVGFAARSDNAFILNAIDTALAEMEAQGLLAVYAEQFGIVHVAP